MVGTGRELKVIVGARQSHHDSVEAIVIAKAG
jgi:hypothetical protein